MHEPVLVSEVLAALAVRAEGCYLDATFGRGGHVAAVLAVLGEQGRIVALDRDPQAIAFGRERFATEPRVQLVQRPFAALREAVHAAGVSSQFDGVLFDLGVSSPQLDEAVRGFSFLREGPLDMRMDNSTGITAAEWLAQTSEREMARAFFEYGEERFARRIASRIVTQRRIQPIQTTLELARLVGAAVPRHEPGKHPATRVFQAIRIAVNAELEQLQQALEQTLELLAPGGRLCVLSFHSLEDRIVKRFMQQHMQDDPIYAGLPVVPAHARARLKRVSGTVHPSAAEVARNPRARSVLLRVAERVAA